jgi:hypothetical protein
MFLRVKVQDRFEFDILWISSFGTFLIGKLHANFFNIKTDVCLVVKWKIQEELVADGIDII